MKRSGMFLLVPVVGVLVLSGCAAARWVAGTSLSRLRAEQEGRYSYRLPLDKNSSFALLTGITRRLEVYEYLSDSEEGYLITMEYESLFPACIDTTEVAFFLSSTSATETLLEIVSLNHALAGFVAANFPYYALISREGEFPEFYLETDAAGTTEILRQVVESRGHSLSGKGPGYLVATGLRLERGEGKLSSPLVFFLREDDSGGRTRVIVGSLDPSVPETALPFLEKACVRALQSTR